MTARQRSRTHAYVSMLMAREGLDRTDAIQTVARKLGRPSSVVLGAYCQTERAMAARPASRRAA